MKFIAFKTNDGEYKGNTAFYCKMLHVSRQVELEYDHLRLLSKIKDWMGETRIARNRQEKPVRITDHAGKTVAMNGEISESGQE